MGIKNWGDWLIADHGYDADWLSNYSLLKKSRLHPALEGTHGPTKCDKCRYRRRGLAEVMFGRIKDWRRVAIRYNLCPKVFISATALAATLIYRSRVLS